MIPTSSPPRNANTLNSLAYEAAKYAERRDDMGRLMLAVMMQARQHIASVSTMAERTR